MEVVTLEFETYDDYGGTMPMSPLVAGSLVAPMVADSVMPSRAALQALQYQPTFPSVYPRSINQYATEYEEEEDEEEEEEEEEETV